MAVSNRLRFEILRRDRFACRYCGAPAADGAVLEIDHVLPKVLGGSDKPENLVAACVDCNSGKSSTHPNSPPVADVDADAVRWWKAARAVADMIRGDEKARSRAYDEFDQAWLNWTYVVGSERKPVPRPDGWRADLDKFREAGLPTWMVLDCVEATMSNKRVSPQSTYAAFAQELWGRARSFHCELGKAVRDVPGPPLTALDFALDLLEGFDLQDRDRAFRSVVEWAGGEELSETTRLLNATRHVIGNLRMDRVHLRASVEKLLRNLPEGVGQAAIEQAYEAAGQEPGVLGKVTTHTIMGNAASFASHEYELRVAKEYLGSLPSENEAALLERTRIIYDDVREHFGEDDWVLAAFQVATGQVTA